MQQSVLTTAMPATELSRGNFQSSIKRGAKQLTRKLAFLGIIFALVASVNQAHAQFPGGGPLTGTAGATGFSSLGNYAFFEIDFTNVGFLGLSGFSSSNFSISATGAFTNLAIATIGAGGTTVTLLVSYTNTTGGAGTITSRLVNSTGLSYAVTNLPIGSTATYLGAPGISLTGTPSALSTTAGTASASTSFNVSGTNTSRGIDVSGPAGFEVSMDNINFNRIVTVGSAGPTIPSTPVYVRLVASDAGGVYSGNILASTTGALGTIQNLTANIAMPASTVLQPAITATGTLAALSTTSGIASASTNFNVSGVNIQAGILVTPPAGFEVSTDNTGFSGNVTVAGTGTIAPTLVYFRLAAADGAKTYSGNIALTSANAANVNVAIPTSTVSAAPTTVTSLTAASSSPTNATMVSYTVTFAKALTTPPSTGDFTLKGSASGTVNSVTGSGTTYAVNVTNVSGDGNLELDMTSGSDALPTISNVPFKGGAYTIDNTAPTAFTLTYASNHAGNSQIAVAGDVISLDFTVGETIQTPALTIAGHSITASNVGGNEWLGTYTMGSSDTEGRIPFTLSFNDLAGNPQPGAPYNDIAAGDNIEFLGSDATLASLGFTPGHFTAPEVFSPAIFNYTLTVGSVPNITLTPVANDPGATVTVNGGDPALPQTLIIGDNTETILVTAADGSTQTYTMVVTRPASLNDNLSSLALNGVKLSATFAVGTTSYTAAVANSFSSTMLTFHTAQTSSTAQIGIASTLAGSTLSLTDLASGIQSSPLSLAVGDNFISVVVTAQDGKTTQTYTVDVVRAAPPLPAVATLSGLTINTGALSPTFRIAKVTYQRAAAFSVTAVTVTATTTDPLATIAVSGTTSATSGLATTPIALAVGLNPIVITVTAQNGAANVYTINVTRAPSSNANITAVKLSSGKLSPAFKQTVLSGYTVTVASTLASINLTATIADANAAATVGAQISGPSGPITPLGTLISGSPFNVALSMGANDFVITCTAQDGTTTKQYSMTIVRGVESANSLYQPISVSNPARAPEPAENITVHQGISPNGDGINDVLVIDGITGYPDNKLSIMSRSGELVFEATGYDNSSKIFDGHSNKNGKMQSPGTYFYSLEYKVAGVTKHKTGFIILKY